MFCDKCCGGGYPENGDNRQEEHSTAQATDHAMCYFIVISPVKDNQFAFTYLQS